MPSFQFYGFGADKKLSIRIERAKGKHSPHSSHGEFIRFLVLDALKRLGGRKKKQ